jgi:cytochrome c oxidase subunit 2
VPNDSLMSEAPRASAGRLASKGLAALIALAAGAGAALAQQSAPAESASIGHSAPGQLGMQTPATPIAGDIVWFHDWLLAMCFIISLFVLGLLIYVMVRFNEKANPTPSKLTHHTGLEVAWTLIPVLILVVIAIPSFRMLRQQLVIPQADLVVKVTASTWRWSYEYPKDQGGVAFDSVMIPEDELKPGQLRLLTVDEPMVVPVNKNVHVQVTAADVIHSFAVPSFGVRIDAVPGRLNDSWFRAEREGVYYGQCSKLCGKDHAYMPIMIRVVSDAEYGKWLASKQKKSASAAPSTFADASASIAR